jgi:hypothetical protein
MYNAGVSGMPLTHIPVVAGPAYLERIQQLPSKFIVTLKAEPDNPFHLTAVAVIAGAGKIGYLPPDLARRYFPILSAGAAAECPGRRAPLSAHENTGTDILLDLTGVPCEP